jgi:hypothetical protein
MMVSAFLWQRQASKRLLGRWSDLQGQGVAGQFMPMGAQAPHFPSQQYSPNWQDLVPQETPVSGFETDASCPPLFGSGGTAEENSDE